MICGEIHSSTFTNLVLEYMKWELMITSGSGYSTLFCWFLAEFFYLSSFFLCALHRPEEKKSCCMILTIGLAKVWNGFTGIVSWFVFSAHNGPFFSSICARFTLIKIIIYSSYEQFYLYEAYIARSHICSVLFSLSSTKVPCTV